MNPEELLEIAQRIVNWGRDGEQVEAIVGHRQETEVRVYKGEIESLSVAESQGVGIRVITNNRQGFAHAGTLDQKVLAETLAEARDNVVFGSPDKFFGLAEPDGVAPPKLNLYNEALLQVSTEAKIDMALELERAVLAGDPRIVGIESADYGDALSADAIATTTGIRSTGKDTSCYLTAYSLASEGDEIQTGFGFSVSREPGTLDIATAASDAVERATRMLGATQPATERVTVVLDPFVSAQFLGIIGGTLSGEAVLKGRSLFANRLDEQVAATSVTLVDDPTNPDAFTASDADGEGLATRRNQLIGGGQLEKFLHNSYTGRRSGSTSTGSAVRGYASTPGVGCQALSLVPGERLPSELIAEIDNGVLIQGVSGLHSGVNPVSGDFSTGAEGLRIRNGELAEPVREITIASTLQRMLLDVTAVGSDLTWLPMNSAGVTIVVAEVTMSGA
ncbi:MAG: TldD/PmbA family protein [Acidimicrobiia bacterium]|nr:TldD/PmbA family protein [Acidimicrobiia bacterium]MYC57118.1 TldD/PmbA family protein [Acidimicrobiia bacterium]MYG94780.1 TldD/PmbA family protein [Acidimicrobiia bacterium]MYI30195.1 TldD/PmbA family protein [Acidimicrobiia bacterium]